MLPSLVVLQSNLHEAIRAVDEGKQIEVSSGSGGGGVVEARKSSCHWRSTRRSATAIK